jgi:hypothetical protein
MGQGSHLGGGKRVPFRVPGKNNPLRQSTWLAAGHRRCPSRVHNVGVTPSCVWNSFNPNLCLTTLISRLHKTRTLPCRCGPSLLLLSVPQIFFEFLVPFTCIRFSIASPPMLYFILSIPHVSCYVITPSSSGNTPSLDF